MLLLDFLLPRMASAPAWGGGKESNLLLLLVAVVAVPDW